MPIDYLLEHPIDHTDLKTQSHSSHSGYLRGTWAILVCLSQRPGNDLFHDFICTAVNFLQHVHRHTFVQSGIPTYSHNRPKSCGIGRSLCTANPRSSTWPSRPALHPWPSIMSTMQHGMKVRAMVASVLISASTKKLRFKSLAKSFSFLGMFHCQTRHSRP